MVGEAYRLKAEIQPDGVEEYPCLLCTDPLCQEWCTLWTAPDATRNGVRHALYHVAECRMFDQPQGEPSSKRAP